MDRTTSKRTPEDLWKQLVLEACEEEIERAASVSVAQAERELHAASAEASVTACPPPLSVCADGQRLKYFDWGQCVAGWCNGPQTIMTCPGLGCSNGACRSGPTM